MDWMQYLPLLVSGSIGYILGLTRDRLAAIRAKQVETITQLQAHVVEIARKELFDGRNMRLTVALQGGIRKDRHLSDEEVRYDSEVSQWRETLREEEDKARLWIDVQTIDMISAYVLLTSHCTNWDLFGQGNLMEDKRFRNYMRCIFGASTNRVLKEVTIENRVGSPWHLNLIKLSHRCLSAIQRRIRLEVQSPLRFRLMHWLERLSGEAQRRDQWRDETA